MTARSMLALGLFVVSLLCSAVVPEPIVDVLGRYRAADLQQIELHHVVAAINRAPAEQLPQGPQASDAARALRQVWSTHLRAERCLDGALASLDAEQLEQVRAGASAPERARTRTHPHTPTELLELVDVLSRQTGATSAGAPPDPDDVPLGELNAEARMRGALALAERGPVDAPTSDRLQAGALQGIVASEALPAQLAALVARLEPLPVSASDAARPETARLSAAVDEALDRLSAR